MTSVTKVHLSVDTIFKFFLFFHKVTFSPCDSDRSDKRSLSHEPQGLRACDKRKPRVTKGVALRSRGLLSHRCFTGLSAVTPVLQRGAGFCHFCHVTRGEGLRSCYRYQEICDA